MQACVCRKEQDSPACGKRVGSTGRCRLVPCDVRPGLLTGRKNSERKISEVMMDDTQLFLDPLAGRQPLAGGSTRSRQTVILPSEHRSSASRRSRRSCEARVARVVSGAGRGESVVAAKGKSRNKKGERKRSFSAKNLNRYWALQHFLRLAPSTCHKSAAPAGPNGSHGRCHGGRSGREI